MVRLYLKLTILSLMMFATQFALTGHKLQDFWYALRCEYAYDVNDSALIERLVAEGGERLQAEFARHVTRRNAAASL